jgi:hypothetical protein
VTARVFRAGGLLLLWAVSCAAAPNVGVPPDWIEVSADGKFSVMAPPGTTFARSAGIDSFTGVFNAPGFAVHVDFGAHVDPLEREAGKTQYLTREVTVDGKRAKLVTARSRTGGGRAYFIGLHVAELRRSAIGPIGLTLTSNLAREQEYSAVESLYLSLRFK